jgi:hypothetical protein
VATAGRGGSGRGGEGGERRRRSQGSLAAGLKKIQAAKPKAKGLLRISCVVAPRPRLSRAIFA